MAPDIATSLTVPFTASSPISPPGKKIGSTTNESVEKDNFKTQLEELSNEIKLSNIIQAPVEKVTKKVIYTVKDKMMMDIKRNNKQE